MSPRLTPLLPALLLILLSFPSLLLSQPPLPTPTLCASQGFDFSALTTSDLSLVTTANVTFTYRPCGFVTSSRLCTANSTSLTVCVTGPSNDADLTSPPTVLTTIPYDPLSPALHWVGPTARGVAHQLQANGYLDLVQFTCDLTASIPYIASLTPTNGSPPFRALVHTALACNPAPQPACGWDQYNLSSLPTELAYTSPVDASQWLLHPCGTAALPATACQGAAVCTNAGAVTASVNTSRVLYDPTAAMWWQEGNGVAVQMSQGDGLTLIVHYTCQWAGLAGIVNATLMAEASPQGRVDRVHVLYVACAAACNASAVVSAATGGLAPGSSLASSSALTSMPVMASSSAPVVASSSALTWMPVVASSSAPVMVSSSAPSVPVVATSATSVGRAFSDPRFVGFRGQSLYVGGKGDSVYSMLLDRDVVVNTRFVTLRGADIHCPAGLSTYCAAESGTYFGAVGVRARNGDTLQVVAGAADEGFHSVHLNGQPLSLNGEGTSSPVGGQRGRQPQAVGSQAQLRGASEATAPAAASEYGEGIAVRLLSNRSLEVVVGLYQVLLEVIDLYLDFVTVDVQCWRCLLDDVRPGGLLGRTWNAAVEHRTDDEEVERYRELDGDLLGCHFALNTGNSSRCGRNDSPSSALQQW